MSGAMLELQRVSKSYGRSCVLSSVSLSIVPRQHVALLGPSGSGKSTVLRVLSGLDAPDDGEVWKEGTLLSSAGRVIVPPHRRGLAMVFQDLALWPSLSARDNVRLAVARSGLEKTQTRATVESALEACGIEDFADRRPGALSAGQQQRVALARSIATSPSVLLLDEPFTGLDLATKAPLLEKIRDLAKERSMTVVLVTHDLMEAIALCRAVVVLEGGRILEEGDLENLLAGGRSDAFRLHREHVRRATQVLGEDPPDS